MREVLTGGQLLMSRMAQLRKELNISQEELAYALSTTQQQISRYENNNAMMNEDMIIRCSRYFGVTTDYLLCLSDSRMELGFDDIKAGNMDEKGIRELIYYYSKVDDNNKLIIARISKTINELVSILQKNDK